MSKKNLKKLSTSIATVTIAAASGITPAMAQTSNGKTEIAKTQVQKTLDNGLVNQKTAKENYAEAKKVNNEANKRENQAKEEYEAAKKE